MKGAGGRLGPTRAPEPPTDPRVVVGADTMGHGRGRG